MKAIPLNRLAAPVHFESTSESFVCLREGMLTLLVNRWELFLPALMYLNYRIYSEYSEATESFLITSASPKYY